MKCWIILGIMFALSTAPDQVGGAAITTSTPCTIYPPPNNGALSCNFFQVTGFSCNVQCNEGFHFERKPPLFYICESGKWTFYDVDPAGDFAMPWPDCIPDTTSSTPPTY